MRLMRRLRFRGTESVIFQDSDGNAKAVSKEPIRAMIAATGGEIRLIVFTSYPP
jgi:hypothetical protein